MKTEKEIIDNLGNWLCTDMERELARNSASSGLPPTSDIEKRKLIRDVADRIKWYRDNIIKKQ